MWDVNNDNAVDKFNNLWRLFSLENILIVSFQPIIIILSVALYISYTSYTFYFNFISL